MNDRIVLVFDVGTQSSRAELVNDRGEILGKSQIRHEPPYVSKEPGFAERDPELYYQNICEAARQLRGSCPSLWDQIEGVSITTIRDTVVCVDSEGKPLRPAILWLDKRLASSAPKLPQLSKVLFKAVGMDATAKLQYQKSQIGRASCRERV